MNKDIKEQGSQQKARIRFQLGYTCGVTVFRVLEQEGIERGCGKIFVGSNGWKIISDSYPSVYEKSKRILTLGSTKDLDDSLYSKNDLNKEIYNNILETFTELGSQGNNPPKEGDRVLVSRDSTWIDRYYITTLPDYCRYRYVVVNRHYEDNYKEGKDVVVEEYAKMKPIQENTFKKISEDTSGCTFEVEFWVNGLGDDIEEED